MPWPWELGQWLEDPTATYLSGVRQWRLPYPQANWRDEKRWNAPLLKAIQTVWIANDVFSKDPETEWGKPENEYFKWMIANQDNAWLTI